MMNNAAVMEQDMMVNSSIAAMEEMVADEAVKAARTMDEAYEAFAGHMSMAKDDFMKMVSVITPLIEEVDAEDNGEAKRQLSMGEMDLVVGGSKWFTKMWGKVKDVAGAVKHKAVKTWKSMPTWAKGAVIATAVVVVVAAGVGIGCAATAAATAAHATAIHTFLYGAAFAATL